MNVACQRFHFERWNGSRRPASHATHSLWNGLTLPQKYGSTAMVKDAHTAWSKNLSPN